MRGTCRREREWGGRYVYVGVDWVREVGRCKCGGGVGGGIKGVVVWRIRVCVGGEYEGGGVRGRAHGGYGGVYGGTCGGGYVCGWYIGWGKWGWGA